MSSAVRVPGTMGTMPMVRPHMPSMYPMYPAGQIPMPQATQPANGDIEFGDVTKMDSASLQDVIQYSGVDLRAEAEMIESELQMNTTAGGAVTSQDLRMRPDYFFNFPRLKAIVYMAVKSRGITNVNEEVFELLSLALQRRLMNIISGLNEISKHRVDAGRASFKIKVENDPKKQLWLLERVYEEQLEKEHLDIGNTAPKKPEETEKQKAKKAAIAEKKSGEDVIVKTRLANTTAMAALGLQQKSWMTAGIVGLHQQQQSTPKPTNDDTNETSEPVENVKIPLHFSQAPSVTPVTDRDLLMQINQKTLTLKDLVFFCERDPHLCRSTIMLTLYDLSNF